MRRRLATVVIQTDQRRLATDRGVQCASRSPYRLFSFEGGGGQANEAAWTLLLSRYPPVSVISITDWTTERDRLTVAAHLERIAGHLRRGEAVTEPKAFVLALIQDAETVEVLWAGLTTRSLPAVRGAIAKRLTDAHTKQTISHEVSQP